MNHEVKGGRGALLAVGILQLVVALAFGMAADRSGSPDSFANVQVRSSLNFVLTFLFAALWAWAKSNPLGASWSGLMLFVAANIPFLTMTYQLHFFIGIPHVIGLFLLIRSVVAAHAARAWEKMEKAAPAPAAPADSSGPARGPDND